MNRRLHVVIVNEGVPYPPTAGNRIRTLNLMLRLAQRHRLTYICRGCGDLEEMRQSAEFLTSHGINTVVVGEPAPRKAGVALYARLAANLLSPVPFAVAIHNSRSVREAIRGYASAQPVDLWQFEWLTYVDALSDHPEARTLIMAHNVESLIWEHYARTEPHPLKRWYLRRQWRKFEGLEGRLLKGASRVVAVSAEDAALMQQRWGIDDAAVVENGIDRAYFESATGERDPWRILFLGSLEWRPNLEAVRLLLDEIMPAVRAAAPSAHLCIVGRNPPAWLHERKAQTPWVQLHANVADVRPFLAGSAVMAVPLTVGGGSRLKILEALACGLPVVSTAVGAEGLALRPDVHYMRADDPPSMAGALVRCLHRPHEALRQAENGRRLVYERYDWTILADRLERIWLQTAQAPRHAAAPATARRQPAAAM